MDQAGDNRRPAQRYVLAAVAVAALAALAVGVSRAPEEPAAGSAAEPQAPARAPTAQAVRFFRELGNTEPEPAQAIALTDEQQLIANSALREVMEFYLIGRSDAQRLQALTAYLNRKLPPAAAREAGTLALHYRDYLAAHDERLAAQNFPSAPDPARMESWQQQRHQLRVRMLGEHVTEEWFGTEDTYLTQALAELQQPAASTTDNADELLHRQHMRKVLQEFVEPVQPKDRQPYAN